MMTMILTVNLMDTRTLGDIGDLFSFCTEYINIRCISVLFVHVLPSIRSFIEIRRAISR